MTRIRIQVLALVALSSTLTYAQQDNKKGYLTGSFETNTIYYKDDSKTKAESPEDHFGSNNYLKLDYYQGKFAVGVQLEAYEPVLVGYPTELEKAKLTNYYVSWADKDFSVTAGTFYEQFGSGLLFRSWEDRMLGLNNAVNLKAEQGDSKKLPVVWTSYLTGFETGSKAINRTLAVEAVNQSFTQSPYLTNK